MILEAALINDVVIRVFVRKFVCVFSGGGGWLLILLTRRTRVLKKFTSMAPVDKKFVFVEPVFIIPT